MSNEFKVIKKNAKVTPVIFIDIGIYYFEYCLQRYIQNISLRFWIRLWSEYTSWVAQKTSLEFFGQQALEAYVTFYATAPQNGKNT